MNTAVVILNFNGVDFLKKFLRIAIENSPEADVIVIDNASTDNSRSYLKENFPNTQIVILENNLGFAGGYNEALKTLDYDYFVLLNSDVEVCKGWLKPMITMANSTPNLAAIQPKIKDYSYQELFEYAGAAGGFVDFLGYPFCRGRIFDSLEKDYQQYEQQTEIFWATGACFFIKSKVFNALNGFDERFFAHFEEIDLCWRIQNLGLSIYYCPNSTVYHVGGGTLHKSNPYKTFLNYRNNLAMLFKNLPLQKLVWILPLRLILDGVSSLKFLKEKDFKSVLAIIKAHFAFYGMIPNLLGKRAKTFVGSEKLYKKSIVWQYFVRGRMTYNQL